MDVAFSHLFKAHTLQTMESSKRSKYNAHSRRQHLVFAPMVTHTLGQCEPDLLQFRWNLADHHAKLHLGPHPHLAVPPSLQQDLDYRRLQGLKYH